MFLVLQKETAEIHGLGGQNLMRFGHALKSYSGVCPCRKDGLQEGFF